jgi:hypothetical protein
MGAIIASGSDRLTIRGPNVARTIGVAASATLVLACATVCTASARGGGGGGGGGGHPGAASSGRGGSMMNGFGSAGNPQA